MNPNSTDARKRGRTTWRTDDAAQGLALAFTFRLKQADGTPAEPP